jgi:CheY-like chemotaxis protein
MENLNLHILLAEDNILCQAVIKNRLNLWHCTVEVVDNGKDALRLLQKNNYNLVLMDIEMPVMDGILAMQLIRKDLDDKLKNIPVIASTTLNTDKDIQNFKEVGFNDYIFKPYNSALLYEKLKQHASYKKVS